MYKDTAMLIMAGLHVLGKYFWGKIFLEISNDAVQRFFMQ